jgi:hypothetical protein
MAIAPGSRLLPGPWDTLARRVAPRWPSSALDTGPAAGSGRRLLRPALWLLLAAAALQSVLHIANLVLFDQQIERFNANWDGSVTGWLGTITTWSAAGAALLLALLVRAVRTPLLLLAGLCAFLSLDDMLVLHEVVARMALSWQFYGHGGYTFWPLVYLPLLGLVGWLVLRTARSIDTGTARYMVAGLACLAAAVVLEASAPVLYALGSDRGQPLYEFEVTIEEALETVGWGVLALGLVAACVDVLLARGAALSPSLATDMPVMSKDRPIVVQPRAGEDAEHATSGAVLRRQARTRSSHLLPAVDRRVSGDRRRPHGDRRQRNSAPLDR